MPPKSDTQDAPRTTHDESEGDLTHEEVEASKVEGTIPRENSLSCRRCGVPIPYDEPPDDGVLHCEECGIANLTPDDDGTPVTATDEESADAAD